MAVLAVALLPARAAAQVAFQNFTEAKASSDVTSLTLSTPAGTSEGDLLVAAIAVDHDHDDSLAPPGGEGWTQIDLGTATGDCGFSCWDYVTLGVWYKQAGASESPTHAFTWTGSEQAYGFMMRFTGHDPTDPIDVSASDPEEESTPDAPSVTTTVKNTLILRLGAFDDDDITVDSPGLPGHTVITMDESNWGFGTVAGGAGYVTQPAVGASGLSAFSLTATENARVVTVAIAPDPLAVTTAIAEIAPTDVDTSSTANSFTYDVQFTMTGSDTGVNRVTVTVPASFGDPTVTDVKVGGISAAYTDNTAGKLISVDLTSKVTSDNTIQVLFTADAPASPDPTGVGFTSTVDDSTTAPAAQSTTEGNADGDGGDSNSWTVTTTDPPAVTSAVAEITWNDVEMNSTGNAFTYDIQATITGNASGVNRVEITVPATFGDPTVTNVLVGGSPVAHTDNTSGKTISIDLTAKVTSSANIQVLFISDAPTSADAVGVDFTSTVDDADFALAAQSSTEGDGDGDAGDNNSWTVTTTDCNDGNECTADSYDTVSRTCNNDGSAMDGQACDTDLFCTRNKVCGSGACGGGTPVDCSHLNEECIVGVCDENLDACVGQVGQGDWYGVNWQYRKSITINNTKVTADLTSFPVLVSLSSDAGLAANAQADGGDILFTDSTGRAKLDHERELYDPNTGQLVAWVEVPNVSSSQDTVIYMYYGNSGATDQANPTGVWDSDYKGVWHLHDDFDDSTSNGNSGTNNGSADIPGQIGDGQSLNGGSNYIQTTSNELKTASGITMSVWFKADITTGVHHLVWTGPGAENGFGSGAVGHHEMHINVGAWDQNDILGAFYGTNEAAAAPAAIRIDTAFSDTTSFHYAAFTVTSPGSSPQGELFLDGLSVGTDTGDQTDRTNWDTNVRIGRPGANERYFDGRVDEVRVSTVARSASWIQTEYNNQGSPATFYSLGSQEALGGCQCDDSNPCTIDSYDPNALGCVFDPAPAEGSSCDDGLYCTTGTICTAGNCGSGSPKDCSFLDTTCVIGICDEGTDACVAQASGGAWYNASWAYRKPIVIDNAKVTADLSSFPVLVSLTDSDLASKARSDGFDILFTASNATSKLDHERELYDPNTGQLVAWVQVTNVSSSQDTVIYMYYGNSGAGDQANATGVWDANYKGVWHMTEVNAVDSTGNGNNGTQYNDVTNVASGKMGPANFFADGDQANGDYIDVGNDPNLQITGALTISTWVTIAGSSGEYMGIAGKLDNTDHEGYALVRHSDNKFKLWVGNGTMTSADSDSTYTDSNWHHVVGVINSGTNYLYVDGALQTDTDSRALVDSGNVAAIGRQYYNYNQRFWQGNIDEVRISNVARSAGWIQTEYNNQNSPGTFYSVGSEENASDCSVPDCDDANPCTTDYYDTGASSCVNSTAAADGLACSTGDLCVVGETCSGGVCGGGSPGTQFRKALTIDSTKVPSDLSNFPVLVSITDADVAADARSDGYDIFFTGANGTKLDHERELYDPNTGQLVAWVEVPSVSSSQDTVIYLYYGNSGATDQANPTGVWDSNYKGVWHLAEDPGPGGAGDIKDSTSSAKHGTAASSMTTTDLVDGKIGKGFDLDGSDDHVNTSLASNAATNLTLSAWFQSDDAGSIGNDYVTQRLVTQLTNSTNSRIALGINNNRLATLWNDGIINVQEGSTTLTAVPTYYAALTYDGSNIRLYLNGTEEDSWSESSLTSPSSDTLQIGRQSSTGRYFDGLIDEVRVSSVARTVDWIQTEYSNQGSPATFYSVGAEEACPAVDHFVISHDGNGIHCLGETITVTAVNPLGNTVTDYDRSIVLSTQTGYGTWSSGGGNDGSFSDPTANDGVATYTFDTADNGSATFVLTYEEGPAVFDIDVFNAALSTLRDDDTEGNITFRASGFSVTSSALSTPPPNPIPAFTTQTAGTEFEVHLTAYGTTPTDPECGVIESYTGAKTLKFWSTYSDPSTGTRNVSVNGTAIATSEGSASGRSVEFFAGRGLVYAKYKDVGQIQIDMKDDTVPEPVGGITGLASFVVRPASFALTSVTRPDDSANPGASTPSGEVFVSAGDPFKATVEVRDSEGDLTPNYGNESAPEGIKLTASTLVAPAGGRNGTNDDGAIGNESAFSAISPAGTFSDSTFYWDEVGAIWLQASVADGDYLGTGDLASAESDTIGRFNPDNFDVSTNSPAFGAACVTFTYLGQSFTYDTAPVFTVTARNAQNGTTQNYTEAGGWFKITNSTLQNRTYTASSGTLDTSGLPSTGSDPAIGNLSAGTATLTFDSGSGLRFDRSTPVAPFDAEITLGIDVIDDDGVAYASNPAQVGAGSGIDFNGGKAMRFGRLIVENAHDSELLDLNVPLKTQYFNGTYYVDITEICTSRTTDDLNLTQNPPGLSTASIAVPLDLSFSAPGANNTGYIDIEVDLSDLSWLQFDWPADPIDGVYDDNPTGRATFGIYKGSSRIIYIREIY